jgi:division protein CdvB (Snf7/Vps24/ESCRT-III family)
VINIFNKTDNWNKKKSLFQRLKHSISPEDPPLKETLAYSIYKLEASEKRLKRAEEVLSRRDQLCLQKCVEAQIAGDRIHAIMYANECAEVRKLSKLVLASELSIEQAILRLETASKITDVISAVVPIADVVRETHNKLAGIIPSAATQLGEVNDLLNMSLKEMGTAKIQTPSMNVVSEEAMKILEQANVAAEEKIREKFPELPTEVSVPVEPIQIGVSSGNIQAEMSTQFQTTPLEDRVYDYIKSCNGQVSILQCAAYLGVYPYDIEKAIDYLKKEGKIEVK